MRNVHKEATHGTPNAERRDSGCDSGGPSVDRPPVGERRDGCRALTVSIPTVSEHEDLNTTPGIFELTKSTTLVTGCAHQGTDQPPMRARDSLQLCIEGR